MINKEEKEKIKKKIKEEIGKTQENILEYKENTKPIAPENAIGRVSRMDAINNKSVAEAALRQAEDKLKRLKYALEKIDNKDFGICARCKNPIPPGRLILMPHSIHCVRCAQRYG